MSATMCANGKARKSLADQIDKLDAILDGLSENLNDAVASAVEQAVRVAVQASISELMANPVALKKLAEQDEPAPKVETEPVPSIIKKALAGFRNWLGRVRQHGKNAVHSAGEACVSCWNKTVTMLATAGQKVQAVRHFKTPLLVAGAVGFTMGVVGYYGAPCFGALFGCMSGFTGTLAVYGAMAWRRLLSFTDNS